MQKILNLCEKLDKTLQEQLQDFFLNATNVVDQASHSGEQRVWLAIIMHKGIISWKMCLLILTHYYSTCIMYKDILTINHWRFKSNFRITGLVRTVDSVSILCLDSHYVLIHVCVDQNAALRHVMANIVAVVLALPERSNHLWYHMFKPDSLSDTYITGFMVCSKQWYCNDLL